ncbi:hypothetical protein, partial [Lysobacter sp. ISL-52]|uniref:hypothetical protein n=1 Tax=Lysobacter sp. ISL-52 TaxID=2819154 RepID=UPI001BEB6553
RDQGHPKGGAHGRAPGATLGRMPNVAPACASIALVAFDSKQPKALSLVTFFVASDKESDPPLHGGSFTRLICF